MAAALKFKFNAVLFSLVFVCLRKRVFFFISAREKYHWSHAIYCQYKSHHSWFTWQKQFTRDKMNIAVYMTISHHVFSPENSCRAFLFSKLNLNLNERQSNPALRTPA